MERQALSHVHTHFASAVGFLLGRTFPVTVSHTFHGASEFSNAAGFRMAEKVASSLFCSAISQHGFSQIMYVSGYSQWSKLERAYLGVDPSQFSPRPFRSAPEPFQIMCAGRLAAVKGQHLLIEAMAMLVSEGRNIRLLLAGNGPDRAALEQDAAGRGLTGRVSLLGNLNQEQLLEYYRQCDVFVLSSFAEGLPVVLMEAMSMEIPCVATWVNGTPEIISHETDGLLIPPGDARALASAVARLMDDEELRRELGKKARHKVEARFDLRRNAEHLAGVFQRRLGRQAGTIPGRVLPAPPRSASS